MAREVVVVLNGSVTPRIVPILEGIDWEPNAPHARFLADDEGFAALLLQAHPDDPGSSPVVFYWNGVIDSQFGGPNDEGRHRHPLYGAGLSGLLWAGEVIDDGPSRGIRHFIIPTKEAVAEVRARQIGWARLDSATYIWPVIERLKGQADTSPDR
jgi:hypothetical protein